MSSISKFFRALGLIISQPSLLNRVLDDADVNRKAVIAKYGFDKGLPAANLLDIAPELQESVEPYSFLDGGSIITDLALLKALARKKNDCSYFEIGTWRGESVANIATLGGECYTLNLSADELRKKGSAESYVSQHALYSKHLPNVKHLEGNSLQFDFSPFEKKFDLVFIDGDHHYESVKSDTTNAFRLLKDDTSVIVWHDAGNSPEDTRWDVIRGILDGCPEDKRKHLRRVSNTLCAIYITQVLPSYTIQYPTLPDKKFEVSLKAKKTKP